MDFEILCYPTTMLCTLEWHGKELIFRQRIPLPSEKKKIPAEPEDYESRKEMDAGALAEAFLKVKTPEQALSFLSASGRFRYLRDKSDGLESVITWREFQVWQRLVEVILVENHLHLGDFESPTGEPFIWGPGDDDRGGISRMLPEEMKSLVLNVPESTFEWLCGHPHKVMYQSKPDEKDPQNRPQMSCGVITDTAIDAILASVFVDTQSGTHFELCAFPDCSNVYEVTSNHAREYCSQPCAHKASVRRKRAEAKAAKLKAKARAAGVKGKKGRK
jgi:hypothetical protein